MPAERVSMRNVREIMRLKFACGASDRRVSQAVGLARSTVAEYLRRAAVAGVAWPLPAGLSDAALEALLFPPTPVVPAEQRLQPDWAAVRREMSRRGVTLQLLWEEYRAGAPDGYCYSHFCDLYRDWLGRQAPTMRQHHVAGDKLFVDYAGQTVDVVDPATGEVHAAQVFVAVLGASNYAYAEATWSQGLADWIGSHVRAFAFFGGVPRQVVCDNLKAGVTKPCRYEPGLNPTYQEMAAHYETAILPTRVRKPRDKAKVEAGVLLVERWILARLRNRRFFSLAALNAEIAALLAHLNDRPFKRQAGSRRSLFAEIDRPALNALPAEPYVFADWLKRRVGIDYHVEVAGHFYSVPYRLLKEPVEVRLTATTVEVFHRTGRIACHVRHYGASRRHTTLPEHMPSAHRRHAEWTPQRLIAFAGDIGPATVALVETILESRRHPEQGFRSCLGILRLAKSYGNDRLEAACARGGEIGARTYGAIASILKNNLDRRARSSAAEPPPVDHANVRGPRYYH
jgi:transposase